MKTHGRRPAGKRNPTYSSWRAMRDRCLCPTNKDYPRYGGAGVTVDARWDDFAVFLADMGERPPGTTLDRLDGTLGYTPLNCRWATPAQQSANRRHLVWLTHNGVTLCLRDWARTTGISMHKLYYRHKRGLPVHEILKEIARCGKSSSSSAPSTGLA